MKRKFAYCSRRVIVIIVIINFIFDIYFPRGYLNKITVFRKLDVILEM